MVMICTNSIRKGGAGCDHRTVTLLLAGEELTWHGREAELDAMAWNGEQKQALITLLLKFCRVNSITLDNLIGRVVLGEEATNVKTYPILCKDVTKTNIGTSYVNIPVGLNGERSLVDFTGCTQYRLILHANLVGTGPFGFRLVRDSDSAVLYENANIALTGERELDTDWQNLPAAASGLILVRLQGKSVTAADDPVVRRCIVLCR